MESPEIATHAKVCGIWHMIKVSQNNSDEKGLLEKK